MFIYVKKKKKLILKLNIKNLIFKYCKENVRLINLSLYGVNVIQYDKT